MLTAAMSGLRWAGVLLAGVLFTALGVYVTVSTRQPEATASARPSAAPEPTPARGPSQWLDGVLCLRRTDGGGTSSFSGFLVHDSGLVVTTAHGIEAEGTYEATFRSGRRTPATRQVLDETLDLALFEVDMPRDAVPLELAELSDIDEGAELWVMGCPEGGEWTVSRGIVASRPSRARAGDGPPLFHADAKAFRGSSGGPLVSTEGKVLGVVKGILEDSDGRLASLPMAIPAPFARAIVSRAWEIRNAERSAAGSTASEWLERGLSVEDPAAKAGAYRSCLDANEHSAACRFNLALHLERTEELEGARAAYRRLLRLRPDFTLAYQNLIALEVENGRLDEAERVCDDALLMLAAPARIANNCGLVARHRGDTTRARERFDLALRIDPGYGLAQLNRAVLIDQDLGRCGDALDDYRSFAKQAPNSPEGLAALAAIEACEEMAP